MIIEYFRPETLEQALSLLARPSPLTLPMGGGTKLNQPSDRVFAVVDLQFLAGNPDLDLGRIKIKGNTISVGAAVTLTQLYEALEEPAAMKKVLLAETPINTRNTATVGGTIVASDGRSGFAAILLAMDAGIEMTGLNSGENTKSVGELLLTRSNLLPGSLILTVNIPLNVKLCYQVISRTPADLPIVAVGVCQWPSSRTRVSLAGYGLAPILAFDGPEPAGAEIAAREAFLHAADAWASAEYRAAMAEILTARCLSELHNGG